MPYSDWTRIITASVVPVVIISANALLCLAFYNRLAAIVSRLRNLQRERLREQELISSADAQTPAETSRRRRLLEHLETQTVQVTRRAKLIRLTLFFMLLTIAMLIGCCTMLGLSVVAPSAMVLAVLLFSLGLLSMLAGTLCALQELKTALQPAELESQFVSQMLHEQAHHSDDSI